MLDDFSQQKPEPLYPPAEDTGHRVPGFIPAGILFSLTALLLIAIGSRAQRENLLIGLLVTEFVLIALPTILFCATSRYSFKDCFRLHRIKPSNVVLIVLASFVAYPIAIGLSLLSLILIKLTLGDVTALNLPLPDTGTGLIVYLLVVAGSAALCEELLFRGFILRGLGKLGVMPSILLSSFLFALFHMDITRFAGTFFLGCMLGFFTFRSASIFASMTAHFTNNAIAVLFGFFTKKLADTISPTQLYTRPFENTSAVELSALCIASIFLIVFFGGILAALLFAFIKNTATAPEVPLSLPRQKNRSLMWFLPGLCIILFLLAAQGMAYAGIRIPWMLSFIEMLSGR